MWTGSDLSEIFFRIGFIETVMTQRYPGKLYKHCIVLFDNTLLYITLYIQ